MKAVLVIDLPDDMWIEDTQTLNVTLYNGLFVREVKMNRHLKPLPKKKEVEANKIEDLIHSEFSIDNLTAKILLDTEKLIALGWNACLKEIEK